MFDGDREYGRTWNTNLDIYKNMKTNKEKIAIIVSKGEKLESIQIEATWKFYI